MSEETKTPSPVPSKPAATPAAPSFKEVTGDALIDKLRQNFAAAIGETIEVLEQQIVFVQLDRSHEILRFLRDDEEASFDFLTDLTAVHYPEKPLQFEVVYHLYSYARHVRLRVKVPLADGDSIRSVADLWGAANWMEREVYDLFGIHFDGHPDLRRILLPADWVGHPLRRDHDLEYRETDWVRRHLNIREVHPETDLTGKYEMTEFVRKNR